MSKSESATREPESARNTSRKSSNLSSRPRTSGGAADKAWRWPTRSSSINTMAGSGLKVKPERAQLSSFVYRSTELEKNPMNRTMRILFVDDDELLLSCFQRIL